MTWTEIIRREYARRATRYASDQADREWSVVRSFAPRGGEENERAIRPVVAICAQRPHDAVGDFASHASTISSLCSPSAGGSWR